MEPSAPLRLEAPRLIANRYPDERNEDSLFLLGADREVGVLFEECGLGERRD